MGSIKGKANCPICGKPATDSFMPFCSKRCANIDLGKWLKGDYSVPVIEMDDLPEDADEAENDQRN